jgi:hypothetical protein
MPVPFEILSGEVGIAASATPTNRRRTAKFVVPIATMLLPFGGDS